MLTESKQTTSFSPYRRSIPARCQIGVSLAQHRRISHIRWKAMHHPDQLPEFNSSDSAWDLKASEFDLFDDIHSASQFLSDRELPRSSQITLIILYTTTTVLAVLGNLVAIIVLALGNRSKKGLHKYLMNLAVSDLCMACFCMPFTFAYTMLGRWIFGKVMCPIVLFMQGDQRGCQCLHQRGHWNR